MKALVVKPSSLGDVVHAFAFVNALKRARPDIGIDWLVNDIYSGLVKCNTNVGKVWIFKRGEWGRNWHSPGTWGDVLSLLSWIRREKYDVCIDLQGLLRSALMTRFSGAKKKAGFAEAREGARFFYDEKIYPGQGKHAVDKLMRGLSVFGVEPPAVPDFGFSIPENSEKFTKKLLAQVGAGDEYAVFHPGARWKTKMWPETHWRELAKTVSRTLPVVFTGSGGDAGMVRGMVEGLPGVFNFAGSLSMIETAALIKSCKIMVTVDSGPMHIAAAFNRPMAALFGPTSPDKTGPISSGPKEVLVSSGLDCVPCMERECCRGTECMAKLEPGHVADRVSRLLAFLEA